jgi:DNA polymerase III subunit delta'
MWQVLGHDRAVRLLRNSIDTGRVSHAYLLSGPKHVGKLTLALELAKALNCREPDRPCGACRSCRKIAGMVHPDVRVIGPGEGAKNIGIEAVRELQDRVALRPFEGSRKVYILKEAERLSEAAANSLLKTLEEPPPSVVMVLTTLNSATLLPTIVSRCQQVELRPVPASVVEGALLKRYQVEPERARLLTALARGRIGWAIRAASDAELVTKRAELLERLVALPKADLVARFAYAAELATLHGRDAEGARGVLETWQSWWRDLLLYRVGLAELIVNVDFRDRVAGEARRYPVEALGRTVELLQRTITLLAQNVNARLALEVLMLRLPRGSQIGSI